MSESHNNKEPWRKVFGDDGTDNRAEVLRDLSEKQCRWIACYITHVDATKACEQVGIHKNTYWRWRKSEAFMNAIDWCKGEMLDALLAKAFQIATNGNGNPRMIKWLMERLDPDRWGPAGMQRAMAGVEATQFRVQGLFTATGEWDITEDELPPQGDDG